MKREAAYNIVLKLGLIIQCHRGASCNKVYKLGLFHNQLFASNLKDIFVEMLWRCCGGCCGCSVHTEYNHLTDVQPPSPQSPDIIFPVLAHTRAQKLYGYHFMPVFEVKIMLFFLWKKIRYKKQMAMR